MPACGPLLAEAEAGRNWLKGLTEVEPPASLVNNILASTTGVDTQRLRVTAGPPAARFVVGAGAGLRSKGCEPVWAMVRQPRFAMSFGMAFFALSVGLTVAGVKPADLRQISLRPAAIRHTYYNTQARVVRYYDNIRFVYEVQARFANQAQPGACRTRETTDRNRKNDKNDTTQQPEQKQERNYSQTENQLILASAHVGPCLPSKPDCDLPVVSVTTDRRFV
jgi:hypothetical protein